MDLTTLRELGSGAPLRTDIGGDGAPTPALVAVDLDGADWTDAPAAVAALQAYPRPVVVGVTSAALPPEAAPLAEAMTCVLGPEAGGPYAAGSAADLDAIVRTVAHAPRASVTLSEVLRSADARSVGRALQMESLAYSTLLFGPEFLQWLRERKTPRAVADPDAEVVRYDRSGDTLSILLDDPMRHNAFSGAMRAGLLNGLEVAAADPRLRVQISGTGPSFCSGGDLSEFGVSKDPTTAHLLRMRNHVGLALHPLRGRTSVAMHGAAIGAGIEVAAFAGTISAAPGAFFQLPELAYGQIPGAGGTVSIPARIGRWRTAYMALTGFRIDVDAALRWGLIDHA